MGVLASISFLAFLILLTWAALNDLIYFKVPNAIPLVMTAFYFVTVLPQGWEWLKLVSNLTTGATVLILCFFLFMQGYLGGGDAKLLAAVAIWAGFEALPSFLFFMALTGGVLALLLLVFRQLNIDPRLKRIHWLNRLHAENKNIPYSLAIAGGAFAAIDRFPPFKTIFAC